MYCAPRDDEANAAARDGVNAYIGSMIDANSDWGTTVSKDYPHHPKMIENLKRLTFEKLRDGGGAWVGSPATIREKIIWLHEQVGGFEIASLQVNSHTMDVETAEASMRLFAKDVMPQLKKL
jgi:hypothetical protein